MAMTKLPLKRGILLLITAGLLALLLYMYYIVGFGNVVSQFEKTNLYYYAAAFLAVPVAELFFSLTWRSLLANLSIKIKVRQAFLFVYAGMFIDSLVPEPTNISGDLIKVYLASKVTGESSGKTTASVIGHKMLVIIITVGNLVAGLVLLLFNYYVMNEILIFVIVVLALLALSLTTLYYVSTKPQATRKLLYGLIRLVCFILRGRWDLTKLQQKVDELLTAFHEGVRILGANPRALVKPIMLSILSWVFDLSAVFLVFAAIGYPVSADKVLIVYALAGGLQSMGISFIGVTEVITSTLYTILAIPVAVSLTATLLTRFITFWFRLLIAYFAFQYVGLKFLFSQGGNKIAPKRVDSGVAGGALGGVGL
jgi:uncharacterized protein (TIRG00374 family)